MQSKSKVNIYDFKTIYVGNFYVDFFFFALMQKKSLIFLLPKIIFYFILYCLKIISFAKFQKNYEMILKYFSDPVNLVNNFWQKYESKINPVLKVIMEHDSQAIIITNFSEMIITPLKKNCKVKKIISYQDFNNNYQKYSIHNSYLSTYSHKLIAQNSQNAYMLNHDKIITYDSQKLYMKQIGKTGTIIGIIFAIFYFLLGMMINYNYNMTRNLDFLFDSDTYRVYQDFTLINEDHYRIDVHPLFLFCQPLIFLFNGITQNNVISVLLFQAFIGFLSIKYLYQTLNILNKEKWPNLLLCIIYGFSFSTLIFNSTIEIYALSALFLILFWFNLIKDLNYKNKINIYKYVGLGLLATGILITNYVIFIIGTTILLFARKINFKKLIIIHLITISSLILLSYIQQFIWVNSPNIVSSFADTLHREKKKYTDFDLDLKKAQNLVNDVYLNGFVANDLKIDSIKNFDRSTLIFFDNYKIKDLFLLTFYLILIYLLIKNFSKQKILNIGLLLSLLVMSGLHLVYGNENTFLYSQNFMYLIILLFGLNYQGKYHKIKLFLKILCFIEIIANIRILKQLLLFLKQYFSPNFWLQYFNFPIEILGFSVLILGNLILILLICHLLKQYFKLSKVSILGEIILCFIIIGCLFIKLQTFETSYDQKAKSLNISNIDMTLKEKYSEEIESYSKYENQYLKLINQNNIFPLNNFNNEEFFFFGLGNRSKYIYTKGTLKNIDNNQIYQQFDVAEDFIIPNIYTVLIRTKDNNYYKIYEDENGVHIIHNDENILVPLTDKKINLANFDDFKYSEILKVLYQEILFNIKDGVLYPNILTYDEVWYRDAAMGAMVLQETQNIDLISDWILSIDSIYDQANGREEEDNLGELLYLLSLVTDKDNTMVQQILQRAFQIQKVNSNGKYIEGFTDDTFKPDYQTAWLNFGLKQFNIDNNYDYQPIDEYSNLLWFDVSDKKTLPIINFDLDYPYLGYAQRHLLNKDSKIYVSNQLYPLSWENNGSKANYTKLSILSDYFVKHKVSPTHTWAAAELFFLLTS